MISIIGREVIATVGEPWNFVSTAGPNVLRGRVCLASTSDTPRSWCLCDVSPFDGAIGKVAIVAAVHRYNGATPIPDALLRGDRVGVNLLYRDDGVPLDAIELERALVTKTGLLFLAGSIRLV
jgi:hypothetical protein